MNSSATSAKLRSLVEAADSGNPVELGEDTAWALARLVLTLTEALETVDECCGCVTVGPNDEPRKALAAVEELRL